MCLVPVAQGLALPRDGSQPKMPVALVLMRGQPRPEMPVALVHIPQAGRRGHLVLAPSGLFLDLGCSRLLRQVLNLCL